MNIYNFMRLCAPVICGNVFKNRLKHPLGKFLTLFSVLFLIALKCVDFCKYFTKPTYP